jgi:4-hydroxybenzoate polyprenyltransferase
MIIEGLKFLTSTSIITGLNGLMVIFFSSNLYGVQLNPQIFLTTFLLIFSAYNLNKVTDTIEDSVNRPEIVSRRKSFYVVPSIIALILSLALGSLLGVWALTVLLICLIVSLAYSIKLPLLSIKLKKITGMKSFVVAFSWAFACAFLPASIQLVPIEKIILIFFYLFIQILVNTILFDILDIRGDRISGLKTIPILLGLDKTKKLLILINSLLILLFSICLMDGIFTRNLLTLGFGIFYGYFIIWMFSNQNCGKFLAQLLIDRNYKRLLAELLVDGEWIPLVVLLK